MMSQTTVTYSLQYNYAQQEAYSQLTSLYRALWLVSTSIRLKQNLTNIDIKYNQSLWAKYFILDEKCSTRMVRAMSQTKPR